MSLELFFTLQNSQSSTTKPASSGNAGAPAQLQGVNFIDLILTRLTQNVNETEGETESKTGEAGSSKKDHLLQSDNPALDKNPSLNLAKLLAANQDIEDQIDRDIETFGLTPNAQLAEVLALNGQAFENELKPISGITGIKSILKTLLLETEGSERADIIGKLKALAQEESPALIAANLTPEQITQLQEQLLGDAEEAPLFDAALIGIINIQSPQHAAVATLPPGGVAPGKTGSTNPANSLITGGGNELSVGEELDLQALSEGKDFKNLLRKSGANKPGITGLNTGADNAPAPSHDLSTLQFWPFTLTGSLFSPPGWSDPIMDELGLQIPAATANSPASLTSLVTNVQSAGQAHSATQMVAATLQKNAANGENKSITLQLDPPELGRVKIRLEFGENKTLKTTMLIEKPETFLMLQRDAHVLERAIAEIGLDSGDGGMEFELAQHDGDFGHGGNHNGHNAGSLGGKGIENNESEFIETKMDWYVDPETGLTRYDMLV